jgi:hypothetical protein
MIEGHPMKTHLTWSTWSAETGPESCPTCNGPTVLVMPYPMWDVRDEDGEPIENDEVEIAEEVSGHYCRVCRKLTSLSLNAQ